MKVIKLGRKYDPSCCCPVSPGEKQPEVVYPSLYIEGIEDVELAKLPEEGTMTVRYKICNRSENLKTEKTCLTLDILAIEKADAEEVDLDADTGDALDKIAASVAAKLKKDY